MAKAKDVKIDITYDPEKSFMIKLLEYWGEDKNDPTKSRESIMKEVEYIGEIEDKLLKALGEISIYDIGYISTAMKALSLALENAPGEDEEDIKEIIEAQKRNMEEAIRIDTIRVENEK